VNPVSHARKFRPSASFWEATRIAFSSLHKNKLRSFLTLLGIILATTTLIAVTALIHGMNLYISDKVSNMGADGFRIVRMAWFGPWDPKKFYEMMKRNPEIKRDEYEFVQSHATLLKGVGMMVSKRKRVAYKIGADIEKGLYANVNPIGKTITVDGRQLDVIGTMVRPAASFFGDQDTRVLIPYWMMQKMYPNARENAIVVTAKDGQLPKALDEVRTILRIDRRVPYAKPDNFALSTADQMVADFRQITAITFLVMAVLSSIGLLVGGIGVMNIMLVSVTERTQEIGVRKAIGARRRDIILQFLLEASVLTSLGGIAGILFGWIISLISRLVFTSLPAQVPLWAAVLGIVVSVSVGLFFGIWPAYKAAQLDPVEALRYE
jgi:putative ABC transport system permease protein